MKRYLFIFPLLLSAAIGTFAQDCVLRIATGETLVNRENLTVCGIEIQEGGTFINYGIIEFKNGSENTDCVLNGSYWKQSSSFKNYGTIKCKTFSYSVNAGNGKEFSFENNGAILADSIYWHYDEQMYITTGCDTRINARAMCIENDFGGNQNPLLLNGLYKTDILTIKNSQGNSPINFGSNCGDSDFDTKTLVCEGNAVALSVKELTGVENIVIKTAVDISVDGIAILGKITKNYDNQQLKIHTSTNSIVSLCYNPTKGSDNFDFWQDGAISGKILYLSDVGLTKDERELLAFKETYYAEGENQWWHPSGEFTRTSYHVWEGESTPQSEVDIHNGLYTLVRNDRTYQQCLDGDNFTSILQPIELTAFRIKQQFDIINLTWETNNWKFEVEQSYDGVEFNTIGELDGFGTTSEEHFYQYSVRNTHEGILYFRIKQTDFDGGFSYSNVLTIKTATSTNTDRKLNTLKYNMLNIKYDKDSKFIEVRQ